MRLTCPNCNAQYEVDDRVIPRNGRDVQCSACGHTWYQYPMEVALQMRAAELEDDDDDDQDTPAMAAQDPGARAAAPRIDKTVLNVLREEAERELAERQRSRQSLETQPELGLVRAPTRSKAAPPRVHGENDPEPEPLPDAVFDSPGRRDRAADGDRQGDGTPTSRRALLPDIEELTSTLEPGDEPRAEAVADTEVAAERRGFRQGLSTVMLLALALVLLYLLAPLIVSWVPQLDGPLRGYVAMIDALRQGAATWLRDLIGA